MPCADHRIYLELEVRRVDCRPCGAVKRERLDLLIENALRTKRFALYVGRRCRSGTIRDVAEELHLDWQTVKRLEMDYMREPNRRVGTPRPKVIGIDEISIRKGHTYRIVVSDLERRRQIWFGETNAFGLLFAEKSEELVHARLAPVVEVLTSMLPQI